MAINRSPLYKEFMEMHPFDREMFLFTEYIVNKKSVKELAKQVSTTNRGMIREFLLQYKIPLRYKGYAEDLSGLQVGEIKVLGRNGHNKHGQVLWLCKCVCGKEYSLESTLLRRKIVKQCHKCATKRLRGSASRQWTGFEIINANLLYNIKKNAESRGIEYKLTNRYLVDLYYKQLGKCALSYLRIEFQWWDNNGVRQRATASLDRIDSSKPYIEGNVQWVHKHINRMKQNMDEDYFIEMCYLISHKYIEKNTPPMTYEGYLEFVKENS